jgi:hypothetical protein
MTAQVLGINIAMGQNRCSVAMLGLDASKGHITENMKTLNFNF